MSISKIIYGIFLSLLMITSSCKDNSNPAETPVNNNVKANGSFLITLNPANPALEADAYTSIVGVIKDGPTPSDNLFKEVMTSGKVKLLERLHPFCEDCGGNFKCVGEDSCMEEPDAISIGTVTIKGMKYKGQEKVYTIEPGDVALDYQLVGSYPDYPPADEGDTITVSASGTESSSNGFSVKLRGIAPLVVTNESIVLEDGKDITLTWEPPSVSGVSTIHVRINISYHGGDYGEIQADCEDNGSLTIPAALLDKLKSWGTSGYPAVDIIRNSVAYDDVTKISAVMQSKVTRFITIPGEISCDNMPGQCPESDTCVAKKCQLKGNF